MPEKDCHNCDLRGGDAVEAKSKMVFDPPFQPFALVYKVTQQRDDGIPQIDLELERIEIKTTHELHDLVHLEELRKQEVRTETAAKEFNEDFERLHKEGGFREFVRPWQEQLLFHIMEQIGLLKPEEPEWQPPAGLDRGEGNEDADKDSAG